MSQFLARKVIGIIRLNCSYTQYRNVACNLRKESKPTAICENEILHSDAVTKLKADLELTNTLERPLTTPIAAVSIKSLSDNERKQKVLLWQPCYVIQSGDLVSYYKKLSKFRLTTLVVTTTMAGYAMSPGIFDPLTFVMCALGTGLMSAAANSINQYHEVPFDSQMSRTKNRVLVTGKLTPLHAVSFALITSVSGLSLLYFNVNELAALLSGINLVLYTSIYTPMKRMTILNTWIGSIVGAIPPVIGWAGCSGTLDAGAWILAGLLYAWQFPHFNALSWNLRPDYSRAGYRMMAVTNPELCRRTAFRYTIVVSLLSYLAPIFDVTTLWFALLSTPINGYFCYLGYKFYKDSSSRTSRALFKYSLIHLPAIMLLFILCKERCSISETRQNSELKSSRKDAEQKLTKEMLKAIPPAYKDTNPAIQIKL